MTNTTNLPRSTKNIPLNICPCIFFLLPSWELCGSNVVMGFSFPRQTMEKVLAPPHTTHQKLSSLPPSKPPSSSSSARRNIFTSINVKCVYNSTQQRKIYHIYIKGPLEFLPCTFNIYHTRLPYLTNIELGFAFFSCVSWQIKNKYENHSSEICWISSQGHAIWSSLSMTNREGLT